MHHVGILVVSDNWISPSFNSLGILDLHPIFPIFHQSASDIKNPIHKSFISRMQILAHRTGSRYTSIGRTQLATLHSFHNFIICGRPVGRSPQSCTVTDFEMETSNFALFLLISVVSVHFRAIYDETIRCQI